MTVLLDTIHHPGDLRQLSRAQLQPLADELRTFLLESVAATGGHLSSNLGTVELTVALHYVFNTPQDRIVWDVGHQTYAHKILTGRREGMKLYLKGERCFKEKCSFETRKGKIPGQHGAGRRVVAADTIK